MNAPKAQVHRYFDTVAVFINDGYNGHGKTVYFHPKDARRLSRAINKCAKSCETETFIDSTCGTFHLEKADDGS